MVGLSTIKNLWELLDDKSLTFLGFLRHFLARAFGLILVPLVIYLSFFFIHFAVLYKTGDGANYLSFEFQATLEGNEVNVEVPSDVYYGSRLVIRHINSDGGYLHSHSSYYPDGSKRSFIS